MNEFCDALTGFTSINALFPKFFELRGLVQEVEEIAIKVTTRFEQSLEVSHSMEVNKVSMTGVVHISI